MMFRTRLCLTIGLICGIFVQVFSQDYGNRTVVTVEYEYRLEVNITGRGGANPGEELTSLLAKIDLDIVSVLQQRIPNGKSLHGRVPNVKFHTSDTQVANECFAESEACALVQSTITVSYAGQKPEHSVERVTLQLVDEYLKEFSNNSYLVRAVYTYPLLVSGTGIFELRAVSNVMNETELEIFENSFHDVFGAIVLAMEGDMEVTEAHVVYQVTEIDEEWSTVLVNFVGICRNCSNSTFEEVVDGVIQDSKNLGAFESRLRKYGEGRNSDYFADIQVVSYMQIEMPASPPPMDEVSLYDSQAPENSMEAPWYLYVGVAIAVVVILVGLYCIYRHQMGLKDLSTEGDGSFSEYDESNNDLSLSSDDDDFAIAVRKAQKNQTRNHKLDMRSPQSFTTTGKETPEHEIYVF